MSDSQRLSIHDNQALSAEQRTFCDLLADCLSVKDACEQMRWTAATYRRMRLEQPAFELAVGRAREMAQDAYVDKMHEIAATEPDVNRARLKVDTIKWTASKIRPSVYGDKLDISVEHRLDIGGALAAARARATLRPMCDLPAPIEGEFEAVPSVEPARTVDKQSTSQLPDIFD